MDAGTLSIKKIFGQDRRHLVPIFQRPYVWTREEQWDPLWEDLRSVAERIQVDGETRPHFMGAIVLDQQTQPTGHVETRLVIDGQQRLTTIQLLLEAFCDLCKDAGADRHHKALLKLTRNDDPMSDDDDEQFKIWPTTVDQASFRKVMLAGSPDDLRKAFDVKKIKRKRKKDDLEPGDQIVGAYLYFYDALKKWLDPNDAKGFDERTSALFSAVRDHIRMVVIDLDEKDDAQMIFETLNARGTALLPADLVKNFLFHRAQADGDGVDALYSQYWKRFDDDKEYWRQQKGRGHARRARIDTFLQHYLTMRKREVIDVSHLYSTFRNFAAVGGKNASRELLFSIRKYADAFESFDTCPEGSREALFFERLRAMEVTTAYPVLLELFARFGKQRDVLLGALTDLESFLVRRMVCQLSTRSYARFFAELLAAIEDAEDPREPLRNKLLSSKADVSRWPDDEEFLAAWASSPLYRTLRQNRSRMILEALEKGLHTGKTESLTFNEALTVEHVLPQKWRDHWPIDDGNRDAHLQRDRSLHSIGNLTLVTGKLNPSLSNSAWAKKRVALKEHTILQLTKDVFDSEVWDEKAILQRSAKLFDVAKKVWSHPT